MAASYKFYFGYLFIVSIVCLTFSSEEAKVENPAQQDAGKSYNPEADLEIPITEEIKEVKDSGAEPQNTGAKSQTHGEDGTMGTQQKTQEQTDPDVQINDDNTNTFDAENKRIDQGQNIPPVNTYTETNDNTVDPYAELDMMLQTKMANIHSAKEFCDLLDVGCEVLEKGEGEDEDSEKVLVSGEGASQVALFDACNPREQTVALPKDENQDIIVWPSCTRALRCGGCCTSDVFSCEPTETRERFVRVFRTRQPYKGAQRFQFIDAKSVKIIEHTRCDAQCKVKAIHCNPLQQYQSRYCRCVCTNQHMRQTCTDDQIWDDNECACVCPQRKTTFCPHPSRFSDHLCKCTLMQEVAGEIDLALLLANLGGNIVVEPNNEITKAPTTSSTTESTTTTTVTTPTTTSTTTTAPSTTLNPCADFRCFGSWKGKWDDKIKRCRCVPAFLVGKGK